MNTTYYTKLFQKAVDDPLAAVRFAKRVFLNIPYHLKYERYRRRLKIPLQYDLVHDLIKEDEFVLIILDSCRYDYFAEEYPAYLDGKLQKVWSAGNRTPKWVPNLWTQEYDLTYISSIPWPTTKSAYSDRRVQFNPEETFKKTIKVDPDPEEIFTDPRRTTQIALQHLKKADTVRAVIHYGPPHRPYVGEHKILPWKIQADEVRRVLREYRGMEAPKIENGIEWIYGEDLLELNVTKREFDQMKKTQYIARERVKDGILTEKDMREAYRANLRLVLGEVKRLVAYLSTPVVVSADHGEHLGDHFNEIPRYNHPNRTHPVLREVPWFTVEPTGDRSFSDIDEEIDLEKRSNPESAKGELKERLKYLGYY